MRIDSSGRLLVANTSSTGTNAKLVVGSGNSSQNGLIVANTANGTYAGLALSNWTGSSTTNGPYILFDNSTVGGWAIGSGNGVNTFDFCTTWGTPLVRIDSSGNVGIGTTSPAASTLTLTGKNLYLSGANFVMWDTGGTYGINSDSSTRLSFYSGSATERMRIDSSGNLLVGTTSNQTSSRLNVSGTRAAIFTSTQTDISGLTASCTSSNNDETAIIGINSSSASSGVGTFYSSLGSGNGAQNNTNCYHLKAITQGVGINYLYGNGTTSFTSDARLKKNITSTRDGYAEDLCKLRVVKYNWNTASEGEAQELGLIAQEVEQVFPGLVQDADTEIQGFTPKVLKGSVLPFMLLKAIQELNARLTALENK
jgi:hypothetical protein